jgi:hypothetical protein
LRPGLDVLAAQQHQARRPDEWRRERRSRADEVARHERPEEALPAQRDGRAGLTGRERGPFVAKLRGDRREQDRVESRGPCPWQGSRRHAIRRCVEAVEDVVEDRPRLELGKCHGHATGLDEVELLAA